MGHLSGPNCVRLDQLTPNVANFSTLLSHNPSHPSNWQLLTSSTFNSGNTNTGNPFPFEQYDRLSVVSLSKLLMFEKWVKLVLYILTLYRLGNSNWGKSTVWAGVG